MNRRLLTILLPLAAVAAAGCSTFDTDTVATVNGAELSRAQLEDLVAVIPGAGTPAGQPPVEGDLDNIEHVRQSIVLWIRAQVQQDRVAERSLEVPAEAIEEALTGLSGPQGLTGFTDLSTESQELIAEFSAGLPITQQPATIASDELIAYYDQGPDESNIICTSHILVAEESEANAVKARLDDGEDFAAIAITESLDPGSGAAGGDLGCLRFTEFNTQFVPEFVAGAADARVGEPTEPVESDFGFHIILIRTGADSVQGLASFETDELTSIRRADVSIDPRYGTFDADIGAVVSLG